MRSTVRHEALNSLMPDSMETFQQLLKRYTTGEYKTNHDYCQQAIADLLEIAEAFGVTEYTK